MERHAVGSLLRPVSIKAFPMSLPRMVANVIDEQVSLKRGGIDRVYVILHQPRPPADAGV